MYWQGIFTQNMIQNYCKRYNTTIKDYSSKTFYQSVLVHCKATLWNISVDTIIYQTPGNINHGRNIKSCSH